MFQVDPFQRFLCYWAEFGQEVMKKLQTLITLVLLAQTRGQLIKGTLDIYFDSRNVLLTGPLTGNSKKRVKFDTFGVLFDKRV